MSTHQFNENMLPDDQFEDGNLCHLVEGNECRLLDKRRTPGVIKSIDMDGGYFRWEISDFEDKGKYWDVTFERVNTYQFKKGSNQLGKDKIGPLEKRISELKKEIEIVAKDSEKLKTDQRITDAEKHISSWLDSQSKFFKAREDIDYQDTTGPQLLREDFKNFMVEAGLWETEQKTSEIQVMNPHSGDWIRGMQIVMAEMGLKDYRGSIQRSSNTFLEFGNKDNRRKYIEHRLAFIRTYFKKLGIKEAILYRGMTTEWEWKPDTTNQYRFWSSWTFSYKVGQDFAELKPNNQYKNSYLIKRAIPVEKLFMTYIETEAMNKQYLEAEALVLHTDEDRMLW